MPKDLKRFQIHLSEGDVAELDELADEEGRPRAQLIRDAIKHYIRNARRRASRSS